MKNSLLILLCFFSIYSFSQTETGLWTTVSVEKKLNKKWELEGEAELRTIGGQNIYFTRLVERASLGIGADYTIVKGLKVGAGYQLMNKLDTKYMNYQFRNRFNTSVSGRLKFNDFTVSLRERIQLTTKDESKRIKPNGNIDTYKVNPELKWRNRLLLSYNIPNCKITPSISAESNFVLNHPDKNYFDKMRYVMSFSYKYRKIHVFELFGVLNDELTPSLNDDDIYGKYNIGIGYKYSFK